MSEIPIVKARPADEQRRPHSARWKRACGICFRSLRISLILLVFAVVVTAFFLNKVGLPEFVKQRLVSQMRAKGWEVDFSQVRLRWYRGIVADDVHLRRTNGAGGPHLFVQRAECRLNPVAFVRWKLDVSSFKLNGGRVVWFMGKTNGQRQVFTLNNTGGELIFHPNDNWELRSLSGDSIGTRVQFSGIITNGSLIRDWRVPRRQPRPGRDPEALWREIVEVMNKLRFTAAPEIDGTFRGDAADLRSMDAHLRFRVPGVSSPWGTGTNFLLTARLFPGLVSSNGVQADFTLTAEGARTQWGEASEFRLNLEVEPQYRAARLTNANFALEVKAARTQWGDADYALLVSRLTLCPTNAALVHTDLKARLLNWTSPWGSATNADVKLLAIHPVTNWFPARISALCDLTQAATKWGKAKDARVELTGELPFEVKGTCLNTNLLWPDRLRDLPFNAVIQLTGINSERLQAERFETEADWKWPLFRANAAGQLYGGGFKAELDLSSNTRELTFDGQSTFDVHKIEPFLGTNAQKFLKSYSWDKPPELRASGKLTLPAWTNSSFDFTRDVLPSLSMAGSFKVGAAAYKGISFTAAESPFAFTNNVWRITELKLQRPEGDLVGSYTSIPATKQFHWQLRTRIFPDAIKSFFDREAERKAFEFFEFTTPPLVEGEVWGHWREPERTGVSARVSAQNFKFRGESISNCLSTIVYTNFFLAFIEPQLERPGEKGTGPGIGIDFRQQRIWFTNVFGNLNPQAVARAVGKKTGEIMADYIFETSPTVRLNGSVDLKKGSDEDDLHFEISGDRFHWNDFRFEQLAGNIDWIGRTMVLTNVTGIFHGGRAMGYAHFQFPRKKGAEFSFKIALAEVDFHSFMSDLTHTTNRLEGMLNGELTVVAANSAQPNSWMGYGNVHLRDGLIWDIPMFGLFSPILNTFFPGLGNSRAKQGSANFLITNSVISTKDLGIQATAMRMHYTGTFDFEKRIDGRMEAELLRDLPAIGAIISKILWPVTKLFEYRVTGTLASPEGEPLYVIPKILLLPFQPFKLLKDLVTDDKKPAPPKPSP